MECYKIEVYVPESHLEKVKEALFAAGAGRLGSYDKCCWQTLGDGQFRPLPGSRPFIGSHGEVETVREWKLELVCESAKIDGAIAALKAAHPYEAPAFHCWKTAI